MEMSILIPNSMNFCYLCSLVCFSLFPPGASCLSVSYTILLFPLSFFQTLICNHNYEFSIICSNNGSLIDLIVVTLVPSKWFVMTR